MNNKHLSWYKEISNNFIISSRAYFLQNMHTDVCGPMSVEARGGYRYVLTLTDDLSRYGYVYLMKHKFETFEKFKEF